MLQYKQYTFIEEGGFPKGDMFSHCEAWAEEVYAKEESEMEDYIYGDEQLRTFVVENPYCSSWSWQEQKAELEYYLVHQQGQETDMELY